MDLKLEKYLKEKFEEESISEDVKIYFTEINNNRKDISQLNNVDNPKEVLEENIKMLTTYINELLSINYKFGFEIENNSCEIKFNWNNIINNNSYNSNNMWFEIYNNLFNLAILYHCMGLKISEKELGLYEKNIKQACNYFKQAIYIYLIL